MQPCEGCPWRGGRGTLESVENVSSSGIAIIGEGPSREELAQGRCFAGPSGVELDKMLARARIGRSEVAIENAFACWKPDRAKPHEEARAVAACRGRIREWIERVRPKGILLLGGRALRSLLPSCASGASSDGLMRWRGSLLASQELDAANSIYGSQDLSLSPSVKWVMATIHPAAIIRRARIEKFPAMGYRLVTSVDAARLRDALGTGRNLIPLARVAGLPSLGELGEGFTFDLETNRQTRRPELIGVQPLSGGPVYQLPWDAASEWVKEAMKLRVLKVGHNIQGFDLHILAEQGIYAREPFWDTMAAAGMCEPDMARGLYYQAAFYHGHQRPFWKELSGINFQKKDEVRVMRATRAIWEQTGVLGPHLAEEEWDLDYNALDVDSTRLVYLAQHERARKEGWI